VFECLYIGTLSIIDSFPGFTVLLNTLISNDDEVVVRLMPLTISVVPVAAGAFKSLIKLFIMF
jgi:hypothetical protein